MLIEFHLLQNFAPSNLNRDDTNSPKDCEFGGHRRGRISSQCLKRAIRRFFSQENLLDKEYLAERSKRLIGEVAKRLVQRGRPEASAAALVQASLSAVKLSADAETRETQYLLFLGRREIQGLADLVDKHWDALAAASFPAEALAEEGDKKAKAKTAKQKKTEAKEAVPAEVAKQVKALLDGGKAADLALFGRMLADQADLNIDAACQVAHALSTNKISMEMDFFTAVDDLKTREEDAGAGMLGTVEFNSACFYRYANIHYGQLIKNLQDDFTLARKTVEAFLKASVHAIPTGKQNSFAAHNTPSLVLAVVRKGGLYSLANAFEKPIYPERRQEGLGLVSRSIQALDEYWGRLSKVYGTEGLVSAAVCKINDQPELTALKPYEVGSIAEIVTKVMNALPNGREDA